MRRPRAMVLDEVWRGLDGLEPLSGPGGGPLRRTVKLVLDPLVIRPVQNPDCAGPMLTDDGATLLAARLHASSDVLRATASWFTLLKQVRRGLRITEGHPQDLYFQRCFELATVHGAPDPATDRGVAEETLREIHEFAAGRTTGALRQHVTDPARAAELTALIDLAWRRRPATDLSRPDRAGEFAELLDAAADARWEGDDGDGQRMLDDLVDSSAGTHDGIALWHSTSDGAGELGLTVHPLPPRPELGASASTAGLGLPFDRTVHERVFTVLQTSSERAELPPIPELVTAEIARSCSPWALLDESLRVTAAAGVALSEGFAPIEHRHRRSGSRAPEHSTASRPESRAGKAAHGAGGSRAGSGGLTLVTNDAEPPAETAAQRVINSRWQREAYVLQARRLALGPVGDLAADHPLAVIAAELRTPWRPYLRRLWVRLHGRDVREAAVFEPDELWDLLDGVARSVMLDHRSRVKNALSAETTESKAG